MPVFATIVAARAESGGVSTQSRRNRALDATVSHQERQPFGDAEITGPSFAWPCEVCATTTWVAVAPRARYEA